MPYHSSAPVMYIPSRAHRTLYIETL